MRLCTQISFSPRNIKNENMKNIFLGIFCCQTACKIIYNKTRNWLKRQYIICHNNTTHPSTNRDIAFDGQVRPCKYKIRVLLHFPIEAFYCCFQFPFYELALKNPEVKIFLVSFSNIYELTFHQNQLLKRSRKRFRKLGANYFHIYF